MAVVGSAAVAVKISLTPVSNTAFTDCATSLPILPFGNGVWAGGSLPRRRSISMAVPMPTWRSILFTRKELAGFYGEAGWEPMEGMTVMIGRPAALSAA